MRDIVEKIDKVLAETPATEDQMRADFEHLKNSALYTPPEDMSRRWRRGGELLALHFGERPTHDWQKRVVEIWVGTPIDGSQRPPPREN